MAKQKITYVCTNCDAQYPQWQGKCTSCGEWNTIVQEDFDGSKFSSFKVKVKDLKAKALSEVDTSIQRKKLSLDSLNNVLGGGLVQGQVILFAGEPGIGKSTLLTQLCVNSDLKILYISGEESVDQIARRA